VLPTPDHHVPRAERWVLRHLPLANRALRRFEYLAMETLGVGFRHPWILRVVQRIGLAHLRRTVKDRRLRAALTPDYTLGCKRLLMSNTYYPSLTRPNVEVHPTAVREVRGSTVVGADGTEREVDAIVFGTGFHILDMPLSSRVHDAAGRSLADVWDGSPQAYLGTTVSGFPNLFLLLGPNLGTGHSSAFMILEAQLAYLADALAQVRRNGWASVDVRPEVQSAYNAQVQDALPRTVYNSGGCSSYYLDVNGRNSFVWPWSTGRMRARIRDFDVSEYTVREHTPARTARPA
jgi:cation diffusion facilitator CzcD-associated flavoprotein CzcO